MNTLIYGIGIGTLATHLFHSNLTAHELASCEKVVSNRIVVNLQHHAFDRTQIEAQLCDTLIISNRDSTTHEIAIGQHSRHLDYPGFSETTLSPNEQLELQLRAKGSYLLHDHLNDQIVTTLRVQD